MFSKIKYFTRCPSPFSFNSHSIPISKSGTKYCFQLSTAVKCKAIPLDVTSPFRLRVPLGNRSLCVSKGAPGRESRTGTQLVSPASGCEKKKRPLVTRLQNAELSILEVFLASTDAIESNTAPGNPLEC